MVLISQQVIRLHSDKTHWKTGFLVSPERACVGCLYKCQIVDSSLQRTEDNHFNDIFILKTGFFFLNSQNLSLFPNKRWTFNSQKAPAPGVVFSIINSLLLQVVEEDSGTEEDMCSHSFPGDHQQGCSFQRSTCVFMCLGCLLPRPSRLKNTISGLKTASQDCS